MEIVIDAYDPRTKEWNPYGRMALETALSIYSDVIDDDDVEELIEMNGAYYFQNVYTDHGYDEEFDQNYFKIQTILTLRFSPA